MGSIFIYFLVSLILSKYFCSMTAYSSVFHYHLNFIHFLNFSFIKFLYPFPMFYSPIIHELFFIFLMFLFVHYWTCLSFDHVFYHVSWKFFLVLPVCRREYWRWRIFVRLKKNNFVRSFEEEFIKNFCSFLQSTGGSTGDEEFLDPDETKRFAETFSIPTSQDFPKYKMSLPKSRNKRCVRVSTNLEYLENPWNFMTPMEKLENPWNL